MSENVASSTKETAAQCVALPKDLVSQKLVIFYLFFRQWSGTVSMTRADYSVGLGQDSSLPPDEVAANYGAKRVIDKCHLRIFDTLKKRAEAVLNDRGIPFCKGVAVPVSKAEEAAEMITAIAADYNKERDDFVRELPSRCQAWIDGHPNFSDRLSIPSQGDVADRINADFAVCKFFPAEANIDKNQSLDRSVNGLFGEVLADVAKRSRLLLLKSLTGKTADKLSQRTLSSLKVIREKLDGLLFINNGVLPLYEFIDKLIKAMPTQGKFSQAQFNMLSSALAMLSNENLLSEVANGKITIDNFVQQSIGESSAVANSQRSTESAPEPSQNQTKAPIESVPSLVTLSQSFANPAPESLIQTETQSNSEQSLRGEEPKPMTENLVIPEGVAMPMAKTTAEVIEKKSEDVDWDALIAGYFGPAEKDSSPTETDEKTESKVEEPESDDFFESEEEDYETELTEQNEADTDMDAEVPPAPVSMEMPMF